MRRAAKWFAICVAVVVLLVTAVVLLFDWNHLRGPLAGWVSQAMGRDFAIEGDLRADISLKPWLRLQQVRLANAEWADEPEMARIEELDLQFDLGELLRGRGAISEIRVSGARILLEVDEEGRGNWEAEETIEEREEVPVIERLIIEDSKLTLHDRHRQIQLEATIASAEAVSPDEGAFPVSLDGEGWIQNTSFTVQARGGPLLALRQEGHPYPIELHIDVDQTVASLAGTITGGEQFTAMDVDLKIAGPDPAALAPILNMPLPSTRPYALAGRLIADGDIWRFEQFRGDVGDSDLEGTLVFDFSSERPRITGDLVSENLEFIDLGPIVGVSPEQVAPGDGNAEAPRPAPVRVLPDAPLQLEQVRAVDAAITFKGTRVVAPNLPLSDVDLKLDLEQGVMGLAPLRFGLAGGELSIFVTIDSTRTPVHTDYDIRLVGAQLRNIFDDLKLEGTAEGSPAVRMKFATDGDTIREAMATARGDAALIMDGARIDGSALRLIDVSLLEALAFVLTDEEPDTMHARCFVMAFDISDGVMKTEIMVLDTEDSVIVGEGSVDLGDETLALRIVGEPKDFGLGGGRVPVEIGGRFTDVSAGIDATEVVARGALATALAALATPFAAIVALVEPGLAEDSECHQLIQEGERQVK